jgi:hypothetical protein
MSKSPRLAFTNFCDDSSDNGIDREKRRPRQKVVAQEHVIFQCMGFIARYADSGKFKSGGASKPLMLNISVTVTCPTPDLQLAANHGIARLTLIPAIHVRST